MCLVAVMWANSVSKIFYSCSLCVYTLTWLLLPAELELVCLIGRSGHLIGALNIYQHYQKLLPLYLTHPRAPLKLQLIRGQS